MLTFSLLFSFLFMYAVMRVDQYFTTNPGKLTELLTWLRARLGR